MPVVAHSGRRIFCFLAGPSRNITHTSPLLDSPCGPRSPAPLDFCSSAQILTQTSSGVKPSVLFQVEGPLQTPLGLLMGLPLSRSTTSSSPLGLEATLIVTTGCPCPATLTFQAPDHPRESHLHQLPGLFPGSIQKFSPSTASM